VSPWTVVDGFYVAAQVGEAVVVTLLVFGPGVVLSTVVWAVVCWRDRRTHPAPEPEPANAPQAPATPPQMDTEPGINRGLQDDCELLYGAPAYDNTNHQRPRNAIREERDQ
jgi:hypothetical protein